ncbi:MAG: hypothetical protein KDA60_15105 [Planctomycetales bacterium]|nr:hypothetical protein [Planctomycetales bacterium]
MTNDDRSNHWDHLAADLGAEVPPSAETPAPTPPPAPASPPPTTRKKSRPKRQAPKSKSHWQRLRGVLGLSVDELADEDEAEDELASSPPSEPDGVAHDVDVDDRCEDDEQDDASEIPVAAFARPGTTPQPANPKLDVDSDFGREVWDDADASKPADVVSFQVTPHASSSPLDEMFDDYLRSDDDLEDARTAEERFDELVDDITPASFEEVDGDEEAEADEEIESRSESERGRRGRRGRRRRGRGGRRRREPAAEDASNAESDELADDLDDLDDPFAAGRTSAFASSEDTDDLDLIEANEPEWIAAESDESVRGSGRRSREESRANADLESDEDEEDFDDQRREGHRKSHRNIPSWEETVGHVVNSNLASRKNDNSGSAGSGRKRRRPPRRRGGRS